jgi:Fungalysin metallopeptidase (M36)
MRRGCVYLWTPDPAEPLGGQIRTAVVPLARLESETELAPRLSGRSVTVHNAGAFRESAAGGSARHAVPIGDATPDALGDFLFAPEDGGARMDKSRPVDPEARRRYIEAAHFGEVNAYYHLDRIAAYVNELLAELDAPPLPRVVARVNAHPGSAEVDGVERHGDLVAFQGGHYRVPSWKYDIAEPSAISPTGEIHLGPGRRLMVHGALAQTAGRPYRHNASHNAGTLYHEFGHHLQRHTADFRANDLRPPEQQSNRKIATEEGMCDYWAATMLGTPHIWCWHHRHDREAVHRRSLVSRKTMADFDFTPGADPHINGTIWAASLWDLRTHLVATVQDGSRQTDRLVLQALRLIGQQFGESASPTVAAVCRARRGFAVALGALVQADEQLNAGRFRETILTIFAARGIQPDEQAAESKLELAR